MTVNELLHGNLKAHLKRTRPAKLQPPYWGSGAKVPGLPAPIENMILRYVKSKARPLPDEGCLWQTMRPQDRGISRQNGLFPSRLPWSSHGLVMDNDNIGVMSESGRSTDFSALVRDAGFAQNQSQRFSKPTVQLACFWCMFFWCPTCKEQRLTVATWDELELSGLVPLVVCSGEVIC